MSTQPDFTWGDDVMAIADGAGVNATPLHPEDLRNYRPHPAVRGELCDDGLRAILAAWSNAAAGALPDIADVPVPFVLTDHSLCAGSDCERTVCLCAESCSDLAEQACTHHLVLCEDCCLECPECLDGYRQDGA